jgi:hypothetical protein
LSPGTASNPGCGGGDGSLKAFTCGCVAAARRRRLQ